MTIDQSSLQKQSCQKCALQGISSPLHLFQLNEEEALWMCKNVDCTFLQSSDWGSLVVKRSIANISTPFRKRPDFIQRSASSICSAPVFRFKSDLANQSRSTTPAFRQNCPTDLVSSCSGFTLPIQRSFDTPSPVESEEPEHKTLVPIAPFLSGSAHIFNSFETKRIEDKRQQRLQAEKSLNKAHPYLGSQTRPIRRDSVLPNGHTKRRGTSLDSDSLSSCSDSSFSRPSSPLNQELMIAKKVRKVVVSADSLSRIISGDVKFGLRKEVIHKISAKDQSFISTEHTAGLHSVTSEEKLDPEDTSNSGSCSLDENLNDFSFSQEQGASIELMPVGSLESVLNSKNSNITNLPDDTIFPFRHQSSNHIDAINAALTDCNSFVVKAVVKEDNGKIPLLNPLEKIDKKKQVIFEAENTVNKTKCLKTQDQEIMTNVSHQA